MQIRRIRDKLLLSAVAIGVVVAMVALLAVSLVIRQQHLDQANTLLRKASGLIDDQLQNDNNNLLAAAHQLAGQKNLGSTIWYLAQYAQTDIDRETLFNTYQQLARDTYKIGRVAQLSKIAIYDAAGKLVVFALFDSNGEQVGFVERAPAAVFQIATLKENEELNRQNLRRVKSVAGIDADFGGPLPQQEGVHYAVAGGMLAIESPVPIMGEAFDPATGKQAIRQLGMVVMRHYLDQSFAEHLSWLTDTRINVFTPQGFSSGSEPAYRNLEWSGTGPVPAKIFNEITVDGEGYYQTLTPLYADNKHVGTIAALYSKNIVQKNTREMIQTLVLIAFASLLVVFTLAWYFATSISQPLTALSRIFRGVASGEHSGALSNELDKLEKEKRRGDELGDLTQSFMAMNDAINQKIRQINEINASLEQTIAERTSALAAKEQEARTLIENSPDTIARYDRECRRIYVNPAFGAMAAGGVAALLGKKPSEIPGGPNMEIYETKIKEVFASGENAQFELKWPGKDGREIYSHIRLTPEHDLSGKVTAVLGVGRDITERRHAEEETTQLKAQLQTQIERMPIGFIVWDKDFSVSTWNNAATKIFGFTEREALGKHPYDFIVPAAAKPAIDELWSRLIKGDMDAYSVNENLTRDGRTIVCEWTNTPLRNEDGSTTSVLSMVQDVTERRNAQAALQAAKEQAEEANHAKSNFLSNMSHEIRTPMNSIIGMAQLALRHASDKKLHNYLTNILQSGEHLLGIIDDILDFSKIEAGKFMLENTVFNFDQVKQTLTNLVGWRATEKGLNLRFDIDSEIPADLWGDALRLNQILLNYINNAIKFTRQGGIDVRVRKVEETEAGYLLRFEVQDTGIGITEEQKHQLFKAFQQADLSTSRQYGGSGLGLVISQRLAGLMGGEVGCESEPGKGSTFWFTARLDKGKSLPGDDGGKQVARGMEIPAMTVFKGARILLAEDHPINQLVAVGFLEDAGAAVSVVSNGQEALDLLQREFFDCVLMDVQMPVMDGLEATRLIRADADLGKIPVIALTANASDEDRENCISAGMSDFISKPFNPDSFYHTIARWLRKDFQGG